MKISPKFISDSGFQVDLPLKIATSKSVSEAFLTASLKPRVSFVSCTDYLFLRALFLPPSHLCFKIARAALAPAAPMTPPPGWAAAPQR